MLPIRLQVVSAPGICRRDYMRSLRAGFCAQALGNFAVAQPCRGPIRQLATNYLTFISSHQSEFATRL